MCVCVKEKTEVCNDGLSRRFSAWWGGWGTRRGLKRGLICFQLVGPSNFRCVKTRRCGLFQAIPHSVLSSRPCILSELRHSICFPIRRILYLWSIVHIIASRPQPRRPKPAQKKTHKLILDPDMIPALLFLGPISVSGPNRPNTARTFLHLMLLHNKSTHISLNLYFCQQRVYESLGCLCGNSIKWTEISVKQAEA